jgi:uncharacterized protein (TIGR00369 family)
MTAEGWSARNPAFEAVVRESFSRQRHMGSLGARISAIAPGVLHIAAPYDPAFTQQNGFWHGGAIASLADSACGYAAYTLAAPGTDVLAVEFKMNLLAPAMGTSFEARGQVLRPGRTLTVCRADVWALQDGTEVMVATMLSTLIIRPIGDAGPRESRPLHHSLVPP